MPAMVAHTADAHIRLLNPLISNAMRPPILPADDDDALLTAANLLKAGELVAFPTETVYGLGADARNGEAVAKIFAAKGRPRFNPLIVHVSSLQAAEALAAFTALARRLGEAFWPGGLTLVVKRRPGSRLSNLVSAGLSSVALRVPSDPVAQRLLMAAGIPVAAPSANRSGHVSATTAQHVAEDFSDPARPGPALILDGGPTAVGLESTIVDARGATPALLRPGAVPREALEAVAGCRLRRADAGTTGAVADTAPRTSPGQLASHYAPTKQVILGIAHPTPEQALLAFGAAPPHRGPCFNLSPRGDLIEASANLFEGLRRLDQTEATEIAVMAIPETGLGAAINDRLRRAAAPRPSA
jgi:L-threonylcarbamoyladenylate synthase